MPALKREKTKYPGVVFIMSKGADGNPEKVFYIRYRKDGKLVEEKAGRQRQDDMTAAKASNIRVSRIEGTTKSRAEIRHEEAQRKTMAKLWDAFKAEKEHSLKSFPEDSYRWHKHLEKDFANMSPAEIITLDVDRVRHRLTKAGYAPASVKQVLVLLKRVLNFGVRRGLCPAIDPARLHFEMPSIDNIRTEDLAPDELSALLKAISEDTHPVAGNLMLLALTTGMRRGEMLNLKWEDINYQTGFIFLRSPKGGKGQSIPLNPAAENLFKGLPRNGEYVFPARGGGKRSSSTLYEAMKRICAEAGLPKDFRPLHGLRHAYASSLASSGQVDLYTLQRLLTHKSPQMTQRYAHLRDEALRNASNIASDIVTRAMNGNVTPIENAGGEK